MWKGENEGQGQGQGLTGENNTDTGSRFSSWPTVAHLSSNLKQSRETTVCVSFSLSLSLCVYL